MAWNTDLTAATLTAIQLAAQLIIPQQDAVHKVVAIQGVKDLSLA
jgi:hypothetical protein